MTNELGASTAVLESSLNQIADQGPSLPTYQQIHFPAFPPSDKSKDYKSIIDNEFSKLPSVLVVVRSPIVLSMTDENRVQATKDITGTINSDFLFLSETKALEVNTSRTEVIQKYVEIMVKDDPEWSGKVRVIIMNKGKEPTAFVYPDGSIFISQSMINLFDSLDEVLAVIAHEVSHLRNQTANATFNAATRRYHTLGTRWVNEMASDAGSSELLEKAGLKSTATADVLGKFAKYFGNARGTEHQAPEVRSLQNVLLHSAKDFETSHLQPTALPSELRRPAKLSNLEAIIDATAHNDIQAVTECLPKLHPQDLYSFFSKVNKNNYALGEVLPKTETQKEVVLKVGELISQRLASKGVIPEKIKLFFLANTERDTPLFPKFHNISEITYLAPIAEQMFSDREVSKLNKIIFEIDGREVNTLRRLVEVYKYAFDSLTDKQNAFYTDYEIFAKFIGTIQGLIDDKLPPVKNGVFVEKFEDILKGSDFDFVRIHEQLIACLFDYIKRFYLPNIQDGELDEQQIEEIFEEVKETGFEPKIAFDTFPIHSDSIGPENTKIIELAYKKVYGKNLVNPDAVYKSIELPTTLEFKELIVGKSVWEIEQLIDNYESDHTISSEKKAEYIQIILDYFDEYDFSMDRLQNCIERLIGFEAMKNWRATGDPKCDSTEATSTAQKEENDAGRRLTVEELMHEYNLDQIALVQEASALGEIDRIRTKIDIIAHTFYSSEEHFFGFIESIMNHSKVDPQTLDQEQLLDICYPVFKLANADNYLVAREHRTTIRDFDRFYQLRFVQELVHQVENVTFTNIEEVVSFLDKAKLAYESKFENGNITLFEDDLHSLLLAQHARDELQRLTQPGILTKQDYPALLKLLQVHFPYSPQRRELIKSIQNSYLTDPNITISDKIAFFCNEYEVLGLEGAVLVAEQIYDVATFKQFKSQLDALALTYISGDESLDRLAAYDVVGSSLTRKTDLLLRTTSARESDSKEISTDLAIHWIDTYLGHELARNTNIQYDEESGKFALSDKGRSGFSSFTDMVDYLKNLPFDKRISIALKILSDENGLLVTEKGRDLLAKMLPEGLELSDDFFRKVLSVAIKKGEVKVLGLPAARMIAPLLFRALSPSSVDLRRVGNAEFKQSSGKNYGLTKVKDFNYFSNLPTILNSTTRSLRYFGLRYHHQPNSVISMLAQESGELYFEILANLHDQLEEHSEVSQESATDLPPATEALIRAGESSPIFIRGMQMAVQLINFEPSVSDRLSQTQDSMKGMNKLSFWENLVAKSLNDPNLEHFIHHDLITLDSYMGGGSLFTTYGATIRGEDGFPKKIVIKMLNPNAEEFINLSYTFSSTVLADVEKMTGGKTKLDARLASTLLELSNSWCLRDINDSTYAERDDAFRSTVDAFNQLAKRVIIKAPNRGYTSKKVKVEDQFPGVTLNKYLSDQEVTREEKIKAVKTLTEFFEHQFQHPFIFHSDPHTGNYMIDPHSDEQVMGVIDRSMYLALDEKEAQLFRLLYDGDGRQFAHEFIDRCLEISGVKGIDANRVKFKVLTRLMRQFVKQKFTGETNVTEFLQIILQEFANYGEKYSATSATNELTPSENIIITYFRQNPESEVITAYEKLSAQLLQGKNGVRPLTYVEFRKILSKMQNEGKIEKRAIEIPIDYRLMIRNILAMRKLRQTWQV